MATCEVCGNNYDKPISISIAGGDAHTFDSLECAITKLAPSCAHCGCRIIGHGVDAGSQIFCCAHCAREGGETRARDRV